MQQPTLPPPRLAAVMLLALATQVLLAEDVQEEAKEAEAASSSSREPRARATIPCPDCRASGRETCPECAGKGKHMKACPRCSGSGQRPCPVCNDPADEDETTPGSVRCSSCSGRGTLGTVVRRQCSKCAGNGSYRCLTCFGDGLLRCRREVLDHICRRCRRLGTIECRTCGGKRRISREEATRRDRAGAAEAGAASVDISSAEKERSSDRDASRRSGPSASPASGPEEERPSRSIEERFTALVGLLETTESRIREDPRRELLDVYSAAAELERRLEASAYPDVKSLAEDAAATRRRAGALHSRWGTMLEVHAAFARTVKKCDMVRERKSALSPEDPLEAHRSREEDMRLALRIAERLERRLKELGLPSLDQEIETLNETIAEIRERSRELTREAALRAREAEEARGQASARLGAETEDRRRLAGVPRSAVSSRRGEGGASGASRLPGDDPSGEVVPAALGADAPAGVERARTAEGGASTTAPAEADREGSRETPASRREKKATTRTAGGTRAEETGAATPGFLAGVLWGVGACALGALVFRYLLGRRLVGA